jgi:hypothetical protein
MGYCNMKYTCPICIGSEVKNIYNSDEQPIHQNSLNDVKQEAIDTATGNIKLMACLGCSYIYNVDFKESLTSYDKSYNNTQIISDTFKDYLSSLSKTILSFCKEKKEIAVEIGAGNGEFLSYLKNIGFSKCIGYEPKFEDTVVIEKNVILIPEYFKTEFITESKDIDLVVCRHVIEHISEPLEFLQTIRDETRDIDCTYYFEVPNMDWVMSNISIADIFYEHCGYYNNQSLLALLGFSGFLEVESFLLFQEQYLGVICKKTNDKNNIKLEKVLNNLEEVNKFTKNVSRKFDKMNDLFNQYSSGNKNIAIWGAAAKTTTVLNNFKTLREITSCVVDINPDKIDKYIPKCGIKVIKPEDILEYEIDIILITNSIYTDEIKKVVASLSEDIEVINI